MSEFFIKRPIFAWCVAIIIMIAGLISIAVLPVAQYPTIALPQVEITAMYPGASAETMSDTVTQVIEQKMSGIDGLLYMSSTSESIGQTTLTITFNAGTDADIAQVQVQNKLQLAVPQLPQEVQRQGLTVSKTGASYLLVVAFYSRDKSMDSSAIADYVSSNLQDAVSRLPGVGDIQLFGSPHAMRIWLDPDKLANYALTVADIRSVLQQQNMQVSAGQFGDLPQVAGQRLNASIIAQTQLRTEDDFKNSLVRVNEDGSSLKLGDVVRVELGQDSYTLMPRFNGAPAAGLAIKLASNANALNTADGIKAYIASMEPFFPPGLETVYPLDTTPFVRLSIHEVVKTLFEAIILVFLVMFVFLQKFRATLIPAIAVPVVLLGTFGVLSAAGFSINTLTMFGMVLAIGLLVDDAIVVVENVERVMEEEGIDPREAAVKSMRQITGALVGIAMVLSAVFVPMAFFGGSTGAIYRQFSITLVSAMALSAMVALILTPALCATILKPPKPGEKHGTRGFFGWFNRTFQSGVNMYAAGVSGFVRRIVRVMLVYAVLIGGMLYMFSRIPTGFLPAEDQGFLFVEMQLPPGATRERALDVINQVEKYFLADEKDAVESVFAVAGYGFSGQGQNSAMAFVSLKDWEQRKDPERKIPALAARASKRFAKIHDALVFAIVPPAVMDLGNVSGFDLQLQDRSGVGHAALMEARDRLMALASTEPYRNRVVGLHPNGKDDTQQYKIDIDSNKAFAYGLTSEDMHDMLNSGWGTGYVNDFLDKGRIKKVYMQAEATARMLPEDFAKWFIRNSSGKMVPFGSLITRHWIAGSPRLERYNGLPSVELVGDPAPGVSSGTAMAAIEEMAKKLPDGIALSWTGLSLQEKQAGSSSGLLYGLSLIMVFICLAALYESWSIPFSVMLVVPVGIIGVQAAALLFGQANDVYFQVGFLTIIGLSAKNAILIVEFAKALREEGRDAAAAAVEACRLRIRPILMTSFAFILGVVPLAISSGAGSGSQNAIGIGVIGGMLSVTVLGVFFIPVFFVLISGGWKAGAKEEAVKNSGDAK